MKEQREPVDVDKVISMYNSGIRQIDICKELKCGKSTVSGILNKFG